MREFLRSLFHLLAFAAPCIAVDAATTTAWMRWEQELTAAREHANPYRDVTLRATFTGPGGQTFSGYGFWDGGVTFRIRAAFPVPGEWTWKTECSATDDPGLHGLSGTVSVAPHSGENTLLSHGHLRVSNNRRHLALADGTPFLWLGDTAWAALFQATQSDWEAYLDHRVAQKFTVVQVHAANGWTRRQPMSDCDGNAAFTGKGETFQWNPAYWRGVERKVSAANARGLVVYVCAMIEPPRILGGIPRGDLAAVRSFTRQLAARLAGDFVVWSPTADDIWTPEADACGETLKSTNPHHLVIAHPRFLLEPGVAFHGKTYTDAAALQTGNGWQANPYEKEPPKPFSAELAAHWAIAWPLELYRRQPRKPVLNLEGVYDGGNLHHQVERFYAQPYPVRMPRSSGYSAFLSGALGYSFGVGGIWDWGTRTRNASGGWDFATARDAPSGGDMRRFAEFLGGIEWWRLEPDHAVIRDQPADWLHRMTFARSAKGDLAVAYLPDNHAITLDLSGFSQPLHAHWHDPATGRREPVAGSVVPIALRAFTRPAGWEDALLLLTATDPIDGGRAQTNLIPDPSFEQAATESPWRTGDANSRLAKTHARTGVQSLALVNDGTGVRGQALHNAGQARIPVADVSPEAEYAFSVHVRTENVTGAGPGGKPLLVLRWRDAAGNKLTEELYNWVPYGTYDFRPLGLRFQAPGGAAALDVGFRSWWDCLTGTTWFDDARLVRVDIPERGQRLAVLEAEAAQLQPGQIVETIHDTTHVTLTATHPSLEWSGVEGGGERSIAVRFSWEGSPRPLELFVNHGSQGQVKPELTGRIGSFATANWKAYLPPGPNTLRVTVHTAATAPKLCPQIDRLDIHAIR